MVSFNLFLLALYYSIYLVITDEFTCVCMTIKWVNDGCRMSRLGGEGGTYNWHYFPVWCSVYLYLSLHKSISFFLNHSYYSRIHLIRIKVTVLKLKFITFAAFQFQRIYFLRSIHLIPSSPYYTQKVLVKNEIFTLLCTQIFLAFLWTPGFAP